MRATERRAPCHCVRSSWYGRADSCGNAVRRWSSAAVGGSLCVKVVVAIGGDVLHRNSFCLSRSIKNEVYIKLAKNLFGGPWQINVGTGGVICVVVPLALVRFASLAALFTIMVAGSHHNTWEVIVNPRHATMSNQSR